MGDWREGKRLMARRHEPRKHGVAFAGNGEAFRVFGVLADVASLGTW
jgi:hypothetical protein